MASEETNLKINWVSTTLILFLFCFLSYKVLTGQREIYTKLLTSGLKKWTCFFELQKFEGEGKDYPAKTESVVKKKKSLFIYLLERKGQQI